MVSLEEQETIIQYNRVDKYATICTSDTTMMTKLDKLCKSAPNNYKLTRTETQDGKVVTKFYRLEDKSMISFRREKRTLSEEQIEVLRERAKTINFGRGVGTEPSTEISEGEEV